MKFIIFDLDDTLLCGDCERYWSNFMINKGLLNEDDHFAKINQFDEDYRNGVLNFALYSSYIQGPLKGSSQDEVNFFLKEFIPSVINELSDDLTRKFILESRSADKVLIASGSHDFLVKGFADYFEIESSIGTPVEVKNNIFTGEFWTGKTALTLGLIDGIGNADQILKEKFGDKVIIKNFEKPKGFIARKLSSSIQDPVDRLTNLIEEKSMWQKFGL